MRILVTGSREWKSRTVIAEALMAARESMPAEPGEPLTRMTLVHGGAQGADLIAAALATQWRWVLDPHPARWELCSADCRPAHRKPRPDGSSYCPTAGHRRNAEMVASKPDVVVAFFLSTAENRGTRQCVGLALEAGIPVVPHDEHGRLEQVPQSVRS